MYKTVKLDLQAKFELDQFYYVEIIPTAWLSKNTNQILANLYANSRMATMSAEDRQKLEEENPEALAAAVSGIDDDFAFLAKSVAQVVVDWNLVDDEGNKLEIPKKLEAQGTLLEKLSGIPNALLTYIFSSANAEEYVDIPLVNSKPQKPQSITPTQLQVVQAAVVEPEVSQAELPLS